VVIIASEGDAFMLARRKKRARKFAQIHTDASGFQLLLQGNRIVFEKTALIILAKKPFELKERSTSVPLVIEVRR
jgi:hypothetical protein